MHNEAGEDGGGESIHRKYTVSVSALQLQLVATRRLWEQEEEVRRQNERRAGTIVFACQEVLWVCLSCCSQTPEALIALSQNGNEEERREAHPYRVRLGPGLLFRSCSSWRLQASVLLPFQSN